MQNNNKGLLKSSSHTKIKYQSNGHRFAMQNAHSPVSLINESSIGLMCIPLENVFEIINKYEGLCYYKFYFFNGTELIQAKEKLIEFSGFSSYENISSLIEPFAKTTSQFFSYKKPILCVDFLNVRIACLLTYAITMVKILSLHWKDLIGGKERLFEADEILGKINSLLRISHKTKSIINIKKIEMMLFCSSID